MYIGLIISIMNRGITHEDDHRSASRQWITVAILALLIVACLAAVTISMGTGYTVDGARVRLRFDSAVTNYPFCPPEIPCPISMVLNENHFVVWVLRDHYAPQGVETTFQKLIDIPLW